MQNELKKLNIANTILLGVAFILMIVSGILETILMGFLSGIFSIVHSLILLGLFVISFFNLNNRKWINILMIVFISIILFLLFVAHHYYFYFITIIIITINLLLACSLCIAIFNLLVENGIINNNATTKQQNVLNAKLKKYKDLAEKLIQIKSLLDEGIFDENDFVSEKSKLLQQNNIIFSANTNSVCGVYVSDSSKIMLKDGVFAFELGNGAYKSGNYDFDVETNSVTLKANDGTMMTLKVDFDKLISKTGREFKKK